jgi:hypothetical protein
VSFADVVFVNGTILTFNANDDVASELAVRDGAVVAVGETGVTATLIGPDTRVVDLAGGTLLPGLNDSHLHALSFGLGQPPLTLDVSYPSVSSISDVKRVIAERAAQLAPGEWILGTGWDPGYLSECVGESGRRGRDVGSAAHRPGPPASLPSDSASHPPHTGRTGARPACGGVCVEGTAGAGRGGK